MAGNHNSGRPRYAPRTKSKTLTRLFQIADRRGITSTKLADAVGLSEQLISRYRRGIETPGIVRIELLAQALGCELQPVIVAPGEMPAPELTTAELLDALGYTIELRRKT